MGLQIGDIIQSREISIDELNGKFLVVDTFNLMYQFLTTIRMRDGTLLKDSSGNVTSHLLGISSRIPSLMEKGIKLAFVFDGVPPELKKHERERRKEAKIEAQKEFEKAEKEQDIEAMKKYAARTTRLTDDMIKEAKELIKALGLPVIQAPSEGEAQAAHIVRKEGAFASVSQDMDTLLFSSPRLIKNLSIAGKRKKPGQLSYTDVSPELIDLAENLSLLGIDQDQLIALGMLIGTDFNPGGIKGIGPKNALKLVKKYDHSFDLLFDEVKWKDSFDFEWKEVYNLFKKMPVTDDYKLEWKDPNIEKIKELLCEKHDFSAERVEKIAEKLAKDREQKKQKSLFEF